MSQTLQQRIELIASKARWLSIVHGLCWFVVVGVSAAFVFGWIDYALRLDDRGVRVILSAVVAAIVLWSLQRFLLPVMSRRFTKLEVAHQIERQFPQIGDRLSSSLEFLDVDRGEGFESADLRQSVVSETERLAQPLNFQECLDSRATRRSVVACLVLCAGLAIICGLDLESTTLAARRLGVPWSAESWPRWNSLEVVDTPARVALGHDIAIAVRDRRRRLPPEVTLQVLYDGDAEDEVEVVAMQRSEKRFLYQRRNVTRGFKYRAIGGDDDTMAWHELKVVEPVQLAGFDIAVEPQTYTGIAPHTFAAGPVHVFEGSRVSVRGTASRRVEQINLHRFMDDEESVVAAAVADDGVSFAISPDEMATAEAQSGQYWIEMVEADGVVSTTDTRWQWKVVADKPPVVTVTAPPVESYFMATASVPLHVAGTDDLALRNISVVIGGKTIPLFVGPDSVAVRSNSASGAEVRDVARALDLSEFDLQPGDSIELTFAADDYKPQSSESITRVITIISRDDFDYRSQDKQTRLLAKLVEAQRLQRATRSQIGSIETQTRTAGVLSDDDVNRLRASDVQQQQVTRMLSADPGGAAHLIRELIAEIESNNASVPAVVARMNNLAATLITVNRDQLPAVQSDLLRATKLALDANDAANTLEPVLQSIGRQQDGIADELQRMIDQLSQWDDYRRFARNVNEVLKDQQDLTERVRQLPTLGRQMNELSDQERSDLERAAGEQQELAKRVDRLKFEMRRLGEAIRESDPAAAATISSALEASQSTGLSERMRAASDEIGSNQLGNASRSQSDAEAGLQQVLGALTDARGQSGQAGDAVGSNQLAAALAELKSRLARVASRQRTLSDKTSTVVNSSASDEQRLSLRDEQQVLADEVHAIREELKLPKAFEFGMSSVESNLIDAVDGLSRTPLDSTVTTSQQLAMDRMNHLLSALSAEAKTTRSDSATQNPATSGDSTDGVENGDSPALSVEELRLLQSIQLELLERTAQFDQQRSGSRELTDQQQRILERLAREQGELAELLLDAIPPHSSNAVPEGPDMPDPSENNLERLLEEAGIPGF